WDGARACFRRLESNTYKTHVRVSLSRYRAYVSCPKCNGSRYQPEALNYRIQGAAVPSLPSQRGGLETASPCLTLPELQALSISDARDLLRAIECSPNDKTAQMLRDEICARLNYLRDKGNTLLVVEHEEQIIRAADNLIDLGPGRGEHGGDLVWNGPLEEFLNGAGAPSRRMVMANRREGAPAPSFTCDYLTNRK